MKVKELIKALEDANPEALVVLSRDEEGNGYNELISIATGMTYRNGAIGHTTLTPYLKEDGYSEEYILDGGFDCVVLWP